MFHINILVSLLTTYTQTNIKTPQSKALPLPYQMIVFFYPAEPHRIIIRERKLLNVWHFKWSKI